MIKIPKRFLIASKLHDATANQRCITNFCGPIHHEFRSEIGSLHSPFCLGNVAQQESKNTLLPTGTRSQTVFSKSIGGLFDLLPSGLRESGVVFKFEHPFDDQDSKA